MTTRRLGVLQWFGLLGAALAWAGQQVLGYGVTAARCSIGGSRWGIDHDVWQLGLLGVGASVVVAAEVAAAVVFVRTRGTEADDPPPEGRLHFLSAAALVANPLFLTAMLLDALASVYGTLCRQA
jgi:uncharacterized membrane protein YeiB